MGQYGQYGYRSNGGQPLTSYIGKIPLVGIFHTKKFSLVDFLKNPTTYDGLESIAETHPRIKSADIYPRMRSLTDEDLYSIAGHIMLQPKILTEKWGGGKIYY